MGSNLEVDRSIQFVSLDTHPANNALVVTYEILVTASLHNKDGTWEEVERRNKRHQFQVHVSALDKLQRQPGAAETGVDEVARRLNLQELAQEVVRKCPRGLLDHRHLEEIQLHLLYLIGRRRGSTSTSPHQTASAASLKLLRSQTTTRDNIGRGIGTTRSQSAASGRRSSLQIQSGQEFANVYAQWRSREDRERDNNGADGNKILATEGQRIGSFLEQSERRLSLLEEQLELRAAVDKLAAKEVAELDEILEGLYGDRRERLVSVAALRRLSGDSRKLGKLVGGGSPRLLAAALLRTLRDSRDHQHHLSQSILHCVAKFTMFDDLYAKMFHTDNRTELEQLLRLALDLVGEQVALVEHDAAANKDGPMQALRALFLIITNLLRCDRANFCRQLSANISHLGGIGTRLALAESLMELVVWAGAGELAENGLSNPSLMLDCLELLARLSIFKEFVGQLRRSKLVGAFIDGLTSLLGAVQTVRPTSGLPPAKLFELYQLELATLRLINQLMLDRRLKQRLIRRQLALKCILRCLVMFLASGEPFELYLSSTCLLVPLKGLYELSCELSVRRELFRSKIIIKCLLEYLLASSLAAAAANLQEVSQSDDGAIVLDGSNRADHYIVCLWVNLSAQPEAPIYRDEVPSFEELNGLCQDCITRSLAKLAAPQALTSYLHAKLLRNLTQFMPLAGVNVEKWLESITVIAERLAFDQDRNPQVLKSSLLVESVAILSNLIATRGAAKQVKGARWSRLALALLKRLEANLNFRETENDDLLLVTILLLARLAQNTEICSSSMAPGESKLLLVSKICEASESILESRQGDNELLVACLFALTQLMRHSSFLVELGNEDDELACRLGDKLAQLLQHPNRSVSGLSVWLLARLRQLEEQRSIEDETLQVHRSRFGAYNDKWLAAMRSGRAAAPGESSLLTSGDEDADEEEEEDADELRELRTFTADASSSSSANRKSPTAADDTDATEDDENIASDHDDDDEFPPDVNVIDEQSMIKHLALA